MSTGGADVSTWTLKALAIGFSTAALLLWLGLLASAWRSPVAVACFGALFVFGPLPLVKLNVLFWGTHELVLLLLPVMLLVVAPWLGGGPSGSPRRAAVRAIVFGALAATLFALNFSLLLPAAFAGIWLIAAEPTPRRRAIGAGCGTPRSRRRGRCSRPEVASRYDGARLYCHLRGEDCRDLPLERFRMGATSPAFLDGMALLTRHQKLGQLAWIDRVELIEVPPEAVATAWIAEAWTMGNDAEREEFLQGVGYALRLLHPPARVHRLDGLWSQLGDEPAAVKRGYDRLPAQLEWGAE